MEDTSDKVSLFSYLRESASKRKNLDSNLTTITKGETTISNYEPQSEFKNKREPYKY